MRHPDRGIEQTKIVVDFGNRPDGRARAAAGSLLLDGDGRAQAVDRIYIRPFHLVEKLPRIGREGLNIAPLAFGIDRIEGQRRLARTAEPVITVRVLRGISTSMFLRLCWRAPRTEILLMPILPDSCAFYDLP